jgi:hypothetical protein
MCCAGRAAPHRAMFAQGCSGCGVRRVLCGSARTQFQVGELRRVARSHLILAHELTSASDWVGEAQHLTAFLELRFGKLKQRLVAQFPLVAFAALGRFDDGPDKYIPRRVEVVRLGERCSTRQKSGPSSFEGRLKDANDFASECPFLTELGEFRQHCRGPPLQPSPIISTPYGTSMRALAHCNCAKAVNRARHGTWNSDVSYTFFDRDARLIDDSGAGDRNNPPPEQQQQQPQPKNRKRCGAALGPGTVTTRFGHQPAYDVYLCAACGFIEWVALS